MTDAIDCKHSADANLMATSTKRQKIGSESSSKTIQQPSPSATVSGLKNNEEQKWKKDERVIIRDSLEAVTALELLIREEGSPWISTMSEDLDTSMGGGIPLGQITELVGGAGVGKTQFW